jgi:hypothetical protein
MSELALGRNDLCWCGSGKKHKRCHEVADAARRTVLIKRQNLENAAAKLREDIFHDYDDDFDADDAWGLVVLLKQQAEAVELLPYSRQEE